MSECVLSRLAERLSKKYSQEVLTVDIQESYFAESVIVFTGTEDKFVAALDKYGVNGPVLFDAGRCEVCVLTTKGFWLCVRASMPSEREELGIPRGVVHGTLPEEETFQDLVSDIKSKIVNNIDKISEKVIDNIRRRTGDNIQFADSIIEDDDIIPVLRELMLVPQDLSDTELRVILSSHSLWPVMHKLKTLISEKVREIRIKRKIEERMKERKELIDRAVKECIEWFKERNVKVSRANFKACIIEKGIPLSWEDTRTAYSILREKLKQHRT